LEKLEQSAVAFLSELWVLFEILLHLNGQHVDQVLGSGVLNRNFNDFLSEVSKMKNSIND
jgi:hypothetical protein